DYVPNISSLAQQHFDLVIGVGFLMADAVDTVAHKFPDVNFAIVDFSQAALKHKPKNVVGIPFKEQESGYLAGYLAALEVKHEGGPQVVSTVGGQKIPARRPLHRRLPGGREGRESRREDAERLLAGLRRPGEVQRDRAQHDCAGLARSEEHTSELQSRGHLVCRLLLEKKKKKTK